ncbi:hypothetical protein L6452_00213 [Arctium lappa]|uniref:Uncharacterized protein n=1 Tax=Arctium lappa TaxID=4217 RepID=A0ACB9FDD7_ARCLA|nr:hypothetical protein L6452_00213 [Arctium lappa]
MSSYSPSFQWAKLTEEAIANEPSWNFVSCVHRTNINGVTRHVTTTWSKNLINISLQITIEPLSEHEDPPTCKIDVKTWQFWGKKGLKSFPLVDGKRVDVFWNLRSAKFANGGPEPCSDYHVALVSDHEMVLLLGDQENEALRRTKSRLWSASSKPVLVLKEENVFGKNLFTVRTMLGDGGREHHVVIEAALCENYEPEMWIGVDGIVSVRIANLHWRFRGYEEFRVDGMPVQVLWDVHDWLYMEPNMGSGMFIFRQSTNEFDPDSLSRDVKPNGHDCIEFCHFLHVWKIN